MGFKGGSDDLTELNVAGGTLKVDSTSNKVGIGTTSPGTLLQLEGTEPYLTIKNSTAENSDGGCESKIIFEDHANVTLAQIQGSHDGSSDDTKGDLIFSTHDGSSLDEALRIDSAQLATFAAAATVTTDLTVGGDLILDDGGSIKEAGGTAAITIDASGNVTKIGQDTHTSGQFLKFDGSKFVLDAASGGGGGAVSAVGNGSDNRVATFSSSDALNGEANLQFDGSTLGVTGIVSGSGVATIYKVSSYVLSGSATSTIHKITADGLTVNGVVSGSGVSTIHKVTSDGLTVNGVVSGSGVSTIHKVTADGLTVNGIVSGSGVSTIHKVTADGLTVNGIVSGSGVSTIHKITADGLTVNGVVSGSGVSTIHKVTSDGLTVNGIVSGSGVSTIHKVTADTLTAHVVTGSGTSTIHKITVDQMTVDNILSLKADAAVLKFGADEDILLTHEADRGLILTQATETTAEPVFTIKNTGDLASGGGIEFLLDNGAGEGDDDILGFVSFKGDDSGNGATQFAKLEVLSSDVTDGDEAGKLVFSAMAGGTAGTAAMTELLSIGGEDTANSTDCAVVINEGQIDCDFRVESNWYTHLLFCDANNNGIGVMNNAPVTAFDVINDYQSTTFENKIGTSNIGGGKKIIYSPGANDTLTKGQLYFLHTDGTWDQTDADAVATGASQLLGVPAAGGASQTYPMILEGYIRIPSTEILNVPGSGAVDGLPVYVSTTAGHFDFTAPSGAGDFVRIVGYAIDDHSGDVLIYFNPDKTWVEVG